MKKQITALFIFLFTLYCTSQETADVGTPFNSSFQIGGDIQGTIQNSINEVTGKLAFSVPLTSVTSGTLSYTLNLGYDGPSAFKIGKEQNKYSPTSVVGVGWTLPIQKIVVDNKQTTTRDDDEFYIIDGATNSKLLCIDKQPTFYTFQLEKFANWKITFSTIFNSWTVIKDDGITYTFGESGSSNSREFVSVWGNWIGDSNKTPTGQSAIVWNLSRIEDQWNNTIFLKYELVENKQNTLQNSNMHTEASYLKEIISSKGANIKLSYESKYLDEYYEPHREMNEPDAYQERYEKKYLNNISVYNNSNQIINSYNLGYFMNGIGQNRKRYLGTITQLSHSSGQSYALPSQQFEYNTSGVFQGGLKKIIYPSGGSVTYNYSNKLVLNNNANVFETPILWPSGYQFQSTVVKDNYGLFILRTTNPVSGGKYRFKIFRLWWNGMAWKHNEFTFPHLMDDGYHWDALEDFYAIFENDFYGFVYDKGSTADMYLFHLNNDGRTWHDYTTTNISISGDPYFLSGDGFVGLGSRDSGNLRTYVWNGSSWNYKLINQGTGEYFMSATNNFIVSINERDDTNSVDMITGASHSDYYYIHYLDAEKNWQTKSWSAAADPYINDVWITETSPGNASFFPDNSICGFVAKDNPELFLRWDTNYNLTNVDNFMGSYDDYDPMQPVANSLFTIYDRITHRPYKSARFNGVNWSYDAIAAPSSFANLQFGRDLILYQDNNIDVKYHMYNPNIDSWINNNDVLGNKTSIYNSHLYTYMSNQIAGINQDFIITGAHIYIRSNQGSPNPTFSPIGLLGNGNVFTFSNGLRHTFIEPHSTPTENSTLYHINKTDGTLNFMSVGAKHHFRNLGYKKLGIAPFISSNSMWLRGDVSPLETYFYRIIDDKINNSVYDIVVDNIDINNGSVRKLQYTYNNPKFNPNNSSTFYSEVITENKGFGSGNIGKVVKTFNDGSTDLSMLGLPLEVTTMDVNNNIVKKTTMTWQKFIKIFSNGSHSFYNSYYIRSTYEKEEQFFDGNSEFITEITNVYNTNGLKTSSTSTNSEGKSVKQEIIYAHQQYSFVNDKNMLSVPYQITNKIDNVSVKVEQSKWINNNGKVYITENWSGPTTSNLRLNSQISNVEISTGNVLENNNGKGVSNAVLFGYNNIYEVATISNSKYQDVINELDVTYAQLQALTTTNLKIELMKLYDRLPKAMISLTFYDENGRVLSRVNERKEESFVYYDNYGRLDYITDAQGKVLEKKEYNFAN